MDYVSALPESAQEFLARACNEMYLSSPRQEGQLHSDDGLRECWRAYKRNGQDALSRALRPQPLEHGELELPPESCRGSEEDELVERIDASRAGPEFYPFAF